MAGPGIFKLFVDCIRFPLGKVRLFSLFPRVKRDGNYIQRLKNICVCSHVFCHGLWGLHGFVELNRRGSICTWVVSGNAHQGLCDHHCDSFLASAVSAAQSWAEGVLGISPSLDGGVESSISCARYGQEELFLWTDGVSRLVSTVHPRRLNQVSFLAVEGV